MNLAEQLFTQLKETYQSGRTRPIEWRKQQLVGLRHFLIEQESSLLTALAEDLGKHPSESKLTELQFLLTDIKHTLSHLSRWAKPRRVSTPLLAFPARSELIPEPLGSVLILGAWNYPVQLLLAPMVAAVAAGNTVLLKPSEHAAQTAQVLLSKLPDYLDNDAIKIMDGEVDVASQLTQLPFDHIFYTGGEQAARSIMAAAAENLTPVTLELGGKSPAIVLPDCDIALTARRLVWGKFLNAGQTCIAPDYVLVHHSLKDDLITHMNRCITEFYGDDPQQSDDYGRIIHQRHWQRLVAMLSEQSIAVGGDYDQRERYIAPTLITDVEPQHPLLTEEIFGPLLPIVTVASVDEAIEKVNAKPKPLALYAFSKSAKVRQRLTDQIAAGNVCYNDTLMFMLNDQLPFGGVGRSGMGRYHGQWGFDTFSHLKPVMTRRFMLDVVLRYPPYRDWKDKLLSWFS